MKNITTIEKQIFSNKQRYNRIAYVTKDWKESWDTEMLNHAIARIQTEDNLGMFFLAGITYWDKNKKDFVVVISNEGEKERFVYWENGKGMSQAWNS